MDLGTQSNMDCIFNYRSINHNIQIVNKKFYQYDSMNRLRSWQIAVFDKDDHVVNPHIIIRAGLVDGKKVTTITEITEGTNIGKSNERTPYEQAIFDAQTEINRKVKQGYVEDKDQAKKKGQTATIDKPAKGHVFHPTGYNKGLTLEKSGYHKKRVGIQLKLDGWRLRVKLNSHGATFYTSSGDICEPFPHIEEALMVKYEELYPDGQEIILDGEIYNHELGYNAVAGACASKTEKAENWHLRQYMKFYIFDIVGLHGGYERRLRLIDPFIDHTNIIPVYTDIYESGITVEDIKSEFEIALTQGYEGLIIRDMDAPYHHGKNKQFLKYKPLIDAEFPISGFKKSITGETLGSLFCTTKDGQEFNCDLKGEVGTDKFKKKIWDAKSEYLGLLVTVEFLEYTPDGIPRNPKACKIRHKEDIS